MKVRMVQLAVTRHSPWLNAEEIDTTHTYIYVFFKKK